MKFLKKGFTLPEILLCVAIIGIITAMGMTAAKQSVSKAFKEYYYTAYINLYNVLGDFEEKNRFQTFNSEADVANELAKMFGVSVSSDTPTVVKAKNGIIYNVISAEDDRSFYIISVTVPQAKTIQNPNGNDFFTLWYGRDPAGGKFDLIPLEMPNQTNLLDRRDLLPTYLDDGRVGRQLENRPPIVYRSFRENYCRFRGPHGGAVTINGKSIPILDCDVCGYPIGLEQAILKVERPSKAR